MATVYGLGRVTRARPLAASAAPADQAAPGSRLAVGEGRGRSEVSALRWWYRSLRVLLLAATDAVAIVGTAALAYYAWAWNVLGQSADPYLDLLPLVALFLLSYGKAGLYPGFGMGAVETLRRLSRRTTFIFLTFAMASFVLKLPHVHSRVTIALAWLGTLVTVPLLRFVVLKVVRHAAWWAEPALVVGPRGASSQLRSILEGALSFGYQAGAVVEAERGLGEEEPALLQQSEVFARRGYRVVFVVGGEDAVPATLIAGLQEHFRHVVLVRSLDAVPVEGVMVRDIGGVLGIEFTNQLLLPGNRLMKRSADIVGGALGLVLSAPLIALAAAAIKIIDRGPVFYAQKREGLDGAELRVWKLRTMRVDAEKALEAHLAASPEARREWQTRFKLKDDPRILPMVGRFLRRCSVDELPQFWNVLTGQMSLVGPRPFPEYHLAQYSNEARALRRRVRPGITGLWQVTVRSEGDLGQQQLYDLYYIRNWSLWLDLYVFARTIGAVLVGRGAS